MKICVDMNFDFNKRALISLDGHFVVGATGFTLFQVGHAGGLLTRTTLTQNPKLLGVLPLIGSSHSKSLSCKYKHWSETPWN